MHNFHRDLVELMQKHKAAGITPGCVASVLVTELGVLCISLTETRTDYDKLVADLTKGLAVVYDLVAAHQNNRN